MLATQETCNLTQLTFLSGRVTAAVANSAEISGLAFVLRDEHVLQYVLPQYHLKVGLPQRKVTHMREQTNTHTLYVPVTVEAV